MSDYYGHFVWEDEDGETYYLKGHVPQRRAMAAANRYARTECRLVNLGDDPELQAADVTVRHVWWKSAPQHPGDDESMIPCGPDDEAAEAFTEVYL